MRIGLLLVLLIGGDLAELGASPLGASDLRSRPVNVLPNAFDSRMASVWNLDEVGALVIDQFHHLQAKQENSNREQTTRIRKTGTGSEKKR